MNLLYLFTNDCSLMIVPSGRFFQVQLKATLQAKAQFSEQADAFLM